MQCVFSLVMDIQIAAGYFSIFMNEHFWTVYFVALRPKSTAMVMAGRSVHLTTLYPGQALTSS